MVDILKLIASSLVWVGIIVVIGLSVVIIAILLVWCIDTLVEMLCDGFIATKFKNKKPKKTKKVRLVE